MTLTVCMKELRTVDPDRFLFILLGQAEHREPLAGLSILYHELARTPSLVNEISMGKIRFQWWRDAIEDLYEHPKKNVITPCLEALKPCIIKCDKKLFDELIDQLERSLNPQSFRSFMQLKKNLIQIYRPYFRLITQIEGKHTTEQSLDNLAVGWGGVQMVRSIPMMIAQGHHTIPLELLQQAGVDKGYITPHTKQLPLIIEDLCDLLFDCLNDSYQSKKKSGNLLFYKEMALLYLKTIKKNQYDVFSEAIHRRPNWAEFKLFFYALFG